MGKIKISELDKSTSLKGFYTIGTDSNNESVQVSLEFVGTEADRAKTNADAAATATTNANTATANAEAATAAAKTATSNANTATTKANEATTKANTAAANADTATANANTATANAEAATTEAKKATDEASNVNVELSDDDVLIITDRYGTTKQTVFYLANEELMSYGIEFDTTVSSPTCTRIGNLSLHKSLPVQSMMKGCLLDDDGNVVRYLNPSDWTSETRDGSEGQVMVEIPLHYRKCETEGTKRRVKISTQPLPGFHKVPKMYVSAYQATLDRTNSKLASVVNTTAQYRGGNNNANYDGTYRSFLGLPATLISRTNFRKFARARKSGSTEWNCMTYDMQKALYWLYVIEYATLNSQADYNAELTTEGYHQGGLGAGVTNMGSWGDYNGYYPIVPCGYTDALGNGTGEVGYTITDTDLDITEDVWVPRYRGIENPFGHLWQWTDGINVRINPTDNGGNNLSEVFVCSDPSKFNDSNYDGYSHVGNEARAEGYVKRLIFGEYGEIMPAEVGGGSTTYHCDYHYTNIPTATTLRGVRFGGCAADGASCGLVSANSLNAPSSTRATIGSRLCFIPA